MEWACWKYQYPSLNVFCIFPFKGTLRNSPDVPAVRWLFCFSYVCTVHVTHDKSPEDAAESHAHPRSFTGRYLLRRHNHGTESRPRCCVKIGYGRRHNHAGCRAISLTPANSHDSCWRNYKGNECPRARDEGHDDTDLQGNRQPEERRGRDWNTMTWRGEDTEEPSATNPKLSKSGSASVCLSRFLSPCSQITELVDGAATSAVCTTTSHLYKR